MVRCIYEMIHLQQHPESVDTKYNNRIANTDWLMLAVLHLLGTMNDRPENIFQLNKWQWHAIHSKWIHHRLMSAPYAVDSILESLHSVAHVQIDWWYESEIEIQMKTMNDSWE